MYNLGSLKFFPVSLNSAEWGEVFDIELNCQGIFPWGENIKSQKCLNIWKKKYFLAKDTF